MSLPSLCGSGNLAAKSQVPFPPILNPVTYTFSVLYAAVNINLNENDALFFLFQYKINPYLAMKELWALVRFKPIHAAPTKTNTRNAKPLVKNKGFKLLSE